jgi:DNA-binding XRE family transcriptional regulator
MLAVVKTPRTDIRIQGDVPRAVLNVLKKTFGKQFRIEEEVNAFDTDWYKKTKSEMNVGDAIRGYRELMGLTQEQLGNLLGGKTRHFVSDLERGQRLPSKEVAKELSKIFQISIEHFIA